MNLISRKMLKCGQINYEGELMEDGREWKD
jgi:hypothetical protein